MNPRGQKSSRLTPEQRVKQAHEKSITDLALKLHDSGRKAEGSIDEAGVWSPSALEHYDSARATKHSSRSYTTWHHVYRLVRRALEGQPVPQDVAGFVRDNYPRIHERAMVAAVNLNVAAEAEKERLERKQQLEAEQDAAAKSAAGRLEARRRQLAGLEERLAQVDAEQERALAALEKRRRALRTRLSSVRRSIVGLERSTKK